MKNNRRIRLKMQTLLWLGVFLMPTLSFASYDYQFDSPDGPSKNYEEQVGDKLSRGLTNILFGWSEIGRTPIKLLQDDRTRGKSSAMVLGIPYGLTRFVGRTVTGVYETVTCFAPQKAIFYPLEGDKL